MTFEVKNISISSDGKDIARDVSFIVRSGEICLLMGANGSGKSSVANAIFGHPKYVVSGGGIFLDQHLAKREKAFRYTSLKAYTCRK